MKGTDGAEAQVSASPTPPDRGPKLARRLRLNRERRPSAPLPVILVTVLLLAFADPIAFGSALHLIDDPELIDGSGPEEVEEVERLYPLPFHCDDSPAALNASIEHHLSLEDLRWLTWYRVSTVMDRSTLASRLDGGMSIYHEDAPISNAEVPGTERVLFFDIYPSYHSDASYDQLHQLHCRGELRYLDHQIAVAVSLHIPNDPLFDEQWHLNDTGFDINVTDVWDYYTGSNYPNRYGRDVHVMIYDSGIDYNHSDLAGNYVSNLAYDECDDDGDPSNETANESHGTAVAGLISAVGDNGLGVAGVAYGSVFSNWRIHLLGMNCSGSSSSTANSRFEEYDVIDIFSNSWGYASPTTIYENVIYRLRFGEIVTHGREGRGAIIVFAAGNDRSSGDRTDYEIMTNSRYTIAVGALTRGGVVTSYSNPGASLLISAPGSYLTTTDVSGSGGYNNSSDYTHSFSGTSAAAPVVSGAVALMLDANPELTWRDVQHILVRSAVTVDSSNPSWFTNGAGHSVSHDYGHGALDVGAAVALAGTWVNVPEERTYTWLDSTPSISQPIADATFDALTGVTTPGAWSNSTIYAGGGINLESVELDITFDHQRWCDLRIELISPAGTTSVLSEPRDCGGGFSGTWTTSSVMHWDELSEGYWELRMRDEVHNYTGNFTSWSLSTFGTDR